MKKECEECGEYFTLGINGGTLVDFKESGEQIESMLCNYCIELKTEGDKETI